MIEENGKKPTNDGELDLTELLRRYVEDDADEPVAEGAEKKPTEPTDTYVKPARKRRMTAVRNYSAKKTENDETALPVNQLVIEPELVEEPTLIESVEAKPVTASDKTAEFSAIPSVTEPVEAADKTEIFDFVEPGAKSFDPDVDIFSDFEEPKDELYGDDDADDGDDVKVFDAPAHTETPENSEGTRVFDAVTAKSDAEDTPEAPDDAQSNSAIDDFDLNIMLALGMEDELNELVDEETVTAHIEKQQDELSGHESLARERTRISYEYTTKSQTRQILDSYNSAKKFATLKLVYAAVLTLALLLFEGHSALGITLSEPFDSTVYPVVYIMVGLQLSLLVAAPAYKAILTGIRDFFGGKPVPESIASFSLLLNLIYSIVISFADVYEEAGPVTFNIPVAVMFLMLYAAEYINLRREMLSFGIVSSKRTKFTLENLTMSESVLEKEAFSDMMEEDDDTDDIGVLKVECADFVNDYFLHTNRYPNGKRFLGYVIPAAIIVAAAFFAYSYNDSGTIYGGMKGAISTALVCLPVSVFYMFSHPFYTANLKAYEEGSTIIGESTAEEYADAAIISFDDKNVFPSTGVNVRTVNVFGNNRIDAVLYDAASVFCSVGGPLSDVFDIATRDIGHSTDVKLINSLPGLLQAEVDGALLSFGTIDALEASGVRVPAPLEQHRNDAFDSTVSVMYMVKNGKFIARMLISYVVDSDFEFILKSLDRGGMFVGLKTFDPNITEQFLGRQIKLEDYPIRVIRCKSLGDKTTVKETTGSGLVSKESPKSVIQTVSLCEKLLHARGVNTMLVVISLFVSLAVSALSVIFGAFALSPLFISIYALAWIVPMAIVSKMII